MSPAQLVSPAVQANISVSFSLMINMSVPLLRDSQTTLSYYFSHEVHSFWQNFCNGS